MTMTKKSSLLRNAGLFAAGMFLASSVYAGSEPAPPSSPFRLSQPSIKGTVVFLPADSCLGEPSGCKSADLTLVGFCQKEPVQVFFPEFPIGAFLGDGEDITSITDTGLDGRYLDLFYQLVIGAQNPNLLGVCDTDPSMAITSVNDFVNRNGFINADVTLKFAPPR
jgi:hypothetical protein